MAKKVSAQAKQATAGLQKERDFMSAILETTGALLVVLDPQCRILRLNHAIEKISGYTILNTIGKFLWDVFIIPEDKEAVAASWQNLRQAGEMVEFNAWLLARGGIKYLVAWSMTEIRNKNGKAQYVIASGLTITKSMRAKELLDLSNQRLLENERKLRSIISNVPGAIYRCPHGKFNQLEFLNHVIEDLIGYPAADFYHEQVRSLDSVIHDDDRDRVQQTVSTHIECRSPYYIEYRMLTVDKNIRWVYERGHGVYASSGELLWLDGIIVDITEQKILEAEREKMIHELRDAIAKVKTLSGFLPICAACKKIRDDKGYWNQIEVYIRDHSEAEFSHGLCPDCAAKLYPDFYRPDKKPVK